MPNAELRLIGTYLPHQLPTTKGRIFSHFTIITSKVIIANDEGPPDEGDKGRTDGTRLQTDDIIS
jgi:hypothetical protein